MRKLLTAQQAADRIGCSRAQIYNLVEAKELRRSSAGVVPGKALRVPEEDVEAFIARRTQPAA